VRINITHIIVFVVYSYFFTPVTLAKTPFIPDNSLREAISKLSTDIKFRHSLGINNHALLEEFYDKVHYNLQWFSAAGDVAKRNELNSLISKPEQFMLDGGNYHSGFLTSKKQLLSKKDTLYAEILFSDAALSFLQDLTYPSVEMVKYNGWQYNPDCIAITSLLQEALSSGNLHNAITATEPVSKEYVMIKTTYDRLYALSVKKDFQEVVVKEKVPTNANKNLMYKLQQLGYLNISDTMSVHIKNALQKLQATHNLPVEDIIGTACMKVLNEPVKEKLRKLRWNIRWYRWLSCMQNRSYILVNIAANSLTFFDCNEAILTSKIIVGKTSTPTPLLTGCINTVIYYPYWNVPFSIATKEMLPRLKRNPSYLDGLKIQVLQGNRTFASSANINWHKYSAHNFPFNFRQLPGCHNSLGLIKFDFKNPFNVYLHDTNNKTAFLSNYKFLSHGCIRVEKAHDLALALGIEAEEVNMDSCYTSMLPKLINLHKPVPVFIIYATIDIVNDELMWFEDAYHKTYN